MVQNAISTCHAQFGVECAAVQSECMDWYTVMYTPPCTHAHPPQASAYTGHRHRRSRCCCVFMVQNAISACHAQFGCECAAMQSACMDWYTGRTRRYAHIRIRQEHGHTRIIDIAEMLLCAQWCKMQFQRATRSLAMSVLQCNQSVWTDIRYHTRLFEPVCICHKLGLTQIIDIAEMLQCALWCKMPCQHAR